MLDIGKKLLTLRNINKHTDRPRVTDYSVSLDEQHDSNYCRNPPEAYAGANYILCQVPLVITVPEITEHFTPP